MALRWKFTALTYQSTWIVNIPFIKAEEAHILCSLRVCVAILKVCVCVRVCAPLVDVILRFISAYKIIALSWFFVCVCACSHVWFYVVSGAALLKIIKDTITTAVSTLCVVCWTMCSIKGFVILVDACGELWGVCNDCNNPSLYLWHYPFIHLYPCSLTHSLTQLSHSSTHTHAQPHSTNTHKIPIHTENITFHDHMLLQDV